MKKPAQRRSREGRNRHVRGAGVQLQSVTGFTGRGVEGLDSQKIHILEKNPVRHLHGQEKRTAATETLVSENEKISTMPLSLVVSLH